MAEGPQDRQPETPVGEKMSRFYVTTSSSWDKKYATCREGDTGVVLWGSFDKIEDADAMARRRTLTTGEPSFILEIPDNCIVRHLEREQSVKATGRK